MIDNNNVIVGNTNNESDEESSFFNVKVLYTMLILYWKWFIFSMFVCLGFAYVYLRYSRPVYASTAKILIKDNSEKGIRGGGSVANLDVLGITTENYGVENEQELLRSSSIAAKAIRHLNLYNSYYLEGSISNRILYKDQPISVSMDSLMLEKLNKPVRIRIKRKDGKYQVNIVYYVPITEFEFEEEPYIIEKEFNDVPVTINTKIGHIVLSKSDRYTLPEGKTEIVEVVSPQVAAYRYAANLRVEQTSKLTSVLALTITDYNIQRSIEYLRELMICYNDEANIDKNEKARRTEEFINERVAMMADELNGTDTHLRKFKESNQLIELKIDAKETATNTSNYESKLSDANIQIQLINSLMEFAHRPNNKYQLLPSNVGLHDATSSNLINQYNNVVLKRNSLLHTAAENSPVVLELNTQLDEMFSAIRQALQQSKRNQEIQRNAIQNQLNLYKNQVDKTPEQEQILTQIGREQAIQSGLYLMLLQKREENSIALASTADKGKFIELPCYSGKVSPKQKIIYLIAFAIGLMLPILIIYLKDVFNYRVESHDDVKKITSLPILADVAVVNENAKKRGDIVVHENKNNQMAEIYRSLRTNVQFMLKEGQNKIMFTSSTSGEGKTFNAANLAVSFALLNKKVVMVGLDIRKPRLAPLFEVEDTPFGISTLLSKQQFTWEDVRSMIIPSEVNDNLELMMAGPIPPNPAELVERPALKNVLDMLSEHYDYVIIDTAPVGLVTDTIQIGKYADVTIYVCRADYTPKACLEMLNELCDQEKLRNVGVLINGIDMSKKKNSYTYGYGNYGKYGKYGKYGRYGSYGTYGTYGQYGNYSNSHYGNKEDNSIKLK